MGEDEMIYLLISFILGWIIARMMGEGFSVGAGKKKHKYCKKKRHNCKQKCNADCNDEMLTCLEPKHDDNDNLLGSDLSCERHCDLQLEGLMKSKCSYERVGEGIEECINALAKQHKDCIDHKKVGFIGYASCLDKDLT